MTKLPGLPEEYYPYLYFFDDETVTGFSEGIKTVIGYSKKQRHEKGKIAQEFLRAEKNANLQVKRIVEFICQ